MPFTLLTSLKLSPYSPLSLLLSFFLYLLLCLSLRLCVCCRNRLPSKMWWLRLRPLLRALATMVNESCGIEPTVQGFVELLDS